MGFFGKGQECWVCGRKTTPEGQFLTPDDLKMVFDEVFEDFKASDELEDHCLCQVCAGILKFATQDSVKARIMVNEAGDKIRDKLDSAKSRFKSRFKKENEE